MAASGGDFVNMSMMESLPDEIILHIFSQLSICDLILSARLTCWRWYHLSKDASLWVHVDLSTITIKYVYSDLQIRRMRNGVRSLMYDIQNSLERLTFSNLPVDPGVYELFGSAWKRKNRADFIHLKSLDYSYSEVSPRNLRVALTTHPDIEELYLSHTKISLAQAMEEAMHLPNLKVLVYHDSLTRGTNFLLGFPSEEDRVINRLQLMKVPTLCPLLEVVELYTYAVDLDDKIIQMFLKFCPNLKKLSFIWSASLTVDAFSEVSPYGQQITTLGLLHRHERGVYLKHILPNLPNLLSLTINGHNVYLEDCIAIGECCPKLQELVFEISSLKSTVAGMFEYYLRNGNTVCGLELQHIVQNCKDLRKVHAPYSNLDDDSIIFLTEKCLYLEDVDFSQCHRLTEKSIHALSKNSVCLKKANFQDSGIDHRFLSNLVKKCRKLEEIIFDHRSKEICELKESAIVSSLDTDDSQTDDETEVKWSHDHIDEIPFIDMTASVEEYDMQQALIESLTNDLCDKSNHKSKFSTTSNSVACMLKPNSNIRHNAVQWNHCHVKKLSMRNSLASELLLQDIIKQCPDLTSISLDGSSHLTDNLILTIAKSCPNLHTLHVNLKNKHREDTFGDAGLFSLVSYSQKLEVLRFLYNRNVTPMGLTKVFESLETSMRYLHSISLCVGHGYACSVSVVALHGLKHLTETSKQHLKDVAVTAGNSFMILHLDFKNRIL